MTTSILFSGGTIVDGRGTPPRRGDVLVQGDKITRVTDGAEAISADRVIDISGLTIAPGFIDMHTHSDLQILCNPDHTAKLSQGVTTEVLGQDGLSYAPVNDATLAELRSQLKGWNDDPPGFDWNWRSVGEYLARLDGRTATNCAYLVPHGNLRMMVMGNADRLATPDELEEMKALLRQAMEEGGVGLSTGLTYVPAMYSDTDELVALCEVVAEYGGFYCPHHRNYGADAMGGYRECFEIARRAGVALHLAHCHLSFDCNRGKLPALISMIDTAIAEGVDVSFDSYPYLAGMTTLLSQLPSWALEGSGDEQLARLRDPATRARIIDALDVSGSDGHQGLTVNWHGVHIAGVPGAPELEWLMEDNLAACAAKVGKQPAELALDILLATDRAAPCVFFIGIEAHIRELMQHPVHTVGSDGILVGDRPHPRSWGTFPRMLETYVRNEKVLTLSECIRHMTSSAARRLRLTDRGAIEEGMLADLVVFNPETVSEKSTYADPRQSATGIEHVMVNGIFALWEGKVSGERSGRVIRLGNLN
ncbi:D-aminoacylase [Devosia sp. YIM 151766]|uniref:N-acyl-D-amino-acid deacylase family protein n=1 Tax=Devosia sp. YIM 151766 TaxID=3017325 RepID=UPI00255C2D98|nr:D-aminoacylase [Devosia sp. YIM 151766]WIY52540.1 D-aminoacylase [Devosia sp. YIM 151766]